MKRKQRTVRTFGRLKSRVRNAATFLLCWLPLVGVQYPAFGTIELQIGSVGDVEPGSEVEVPVLLSGPEKVGGVQFDIVVDRDWITPNGESFLEVDIATAIFKPLSPNRFRYRGLVYSDKQSLAESGVGQAKLLGLKLAVADTAASGTVPLKIENAVVVSPEGRYIGDVELRNGTVEVKVPNRSAPTIELTSAASVAVIQGESSEFITFRIGDSQTSHENLQLEVTSSNEAVLPGSSSDRIRIRDVSSAEGQVGEMAMVVTPYRFAEGATTLTLTVIDDGSPRQESSVDLQVSSEIPQGLHLEIGSASGSNGQEVLIPVRAHGLDNVVGLQFSLQWSDSLAEFLGMETSEMEGWIPAREQSNQNSLTDGSQVIAFLWTDQRAEGVSLIEPTTLFTLRLRLIGNPGSIGAISVSEESDILGEVSVVNREGDVFGKSLIGRRGTISIKEQVSLQGRVSYYSNAEIPIPGLSLQLSGVDGNLVSATDRDGRYEFLANPGATGDISVRGESGRIQDGVSAIDIVQLRLKQLGRREFESSFQFIAADVSFDGKLSIADVIRIQQLILGRDDLPLDEAAAPYWRFVDAGNPFADVSDPWSYHESIGVQLEETRLDGLDLVGIKIGDINGSWRPQGGVGPVALTRLNETELDGEAVPANSVRLEPLLLTENNGGQAVWSLRSPDFNAITSMQFSLRWDPSLMAFKSITGHEELELGPLDFAVDQAGQGTLLLSWFDPSLDGKSVGVNDDILVVTFENLSDASGTGVEIVNEPVSIELTRNLEVVAARIENSRVLTEREPPQLKILRRLNANGIEVLSLTFTSENLASFELQRSTHLIDPEWKTVDVYSDFVGGLDVEIEIGGEPTLFYRIVAASGTVNRSLSE